MFNIKLLINTALLSTFSFNALASSQQWAVDIEPGQVVQLIAPVSLPETLALRKQYYRDAIPLAEQYGFKNHGQLIIEKTILGDFKPPTLIMSSTRPS